MLACLLACALLGGARASGGSATNVTDQRCVVQRACSLTCDNTIHILSLWPATNYSLEPSQALGDWRTTKVLRFNVSDSGPATLPSAL